MSHFVVLRNRGPAWDHARPMTEQDRWPEHAAFLNKLADEGFVVLGGPIGNGHQILLVIDAESEAEIRARIDEDPWTPMNLLPISSVQPWQILLGRPSRTR